MKRDPLTWVRRTCLALPGTAELVAWGHPNFRVAGRTFAVFEIYKGRPCIAIASDPEDQTLLVERFGFFKTPYVGSRGWVSAWVDRPAPLGLMRDLIRRAHRRAAAHKRPGDASRKTGRRARPTKEARGPTRSKP